MSGPVTIGDVVTAERGDGQVAGPTVEIMPGRASEVGGVAVRRVLPKRTRRTVGPWCFVDHFSAGPLDMQVGPHPHIGLQTVTWLVEGELVHHDSLGSEQVIRPGQLNLMTAGRGVAHAEEPRAGGAAGFQGLQLWVAQPDATRHGDPAFEHHAELPRVDLASGVATVLVGELAGARSPARRDTDHVGAELDLRAGTTVVPLRPADEHALVVVEGAVRVGGPGDAGTIVTPGHLAYLGLGRDELAVAADGPARALLVGGVPFPGPVLMWWNFVARTHDEVDAARADWEAGTDRFAPVDTSLARIPAPRTPWSPR